MVPFRGELRASFTHLGMLDILSNMGLMPMMVIGCPLFSVNEDKRQSCFLLHHPQTPCLLTGTPASIIVEGSRAL